MALKPLEALKLRERFNLFHQQHSKFSTFLEYIGKHALAPGAVVELKVTDVNGKEYVANIRLTEDDIKTIEMIKNLH